MRGRYSVPSGGSVTSNRTAPQLQPRVSGKTDNPVTSPEAADVLTRSLPVSDHVDTGVLPRRVGLTRPIHGSRPIPKRVNRLRRGSPAAR